jgi:hypothetical protein
VFEVVLGLVPKPNPVEVFEPVFPKRLPPGLFWFWLLPNKPVVLFDPNPVLEDPPKPVVAVLDVPNRPPVDVEVDCDPNKLVVGLFPKRLPLLNPLVGVLPKAVDEELVPPKGLLLVVPNPGLELAPNPPKVLVPNPLPFPNLRPAA